MKNISLFLILIQFSFNSYALSIKDIWNPIANIDDIQIYSKAAKDGVLPFKANATINVNMEKVLYILKNHSTKHEWAPKLEKVTLHKQLSKNQFIFSEYYKTPWPATDREFLLLGEIERLSSKSVILKAHSIDQEAKFKAFRSEDHIQADVKYINVKLDKVSHNITNISFEFHGDMKGWMPLWLMNLIQKKWPMRFIQGLRKYSKDKNFELSYNSIKK